MANLRRDSVVSNAMSADTEFHVSYRRVELQAPFLLVCATDGCFGYLPSPMHFERLVLAPLREARTVDAWSRSIQGEIAAVTGDDAAMSVMAVGADLKELQELYAPRVAELEEQFTVPIDELSRSVQRAEQELQALRQRQLDETEQLWGRYKPGYERYLHVTAEADEDLTAQPEPSQEDEPGASASAAEAPAPDLPVEADGDKPSEVTS